MKVPLDLPVGVVSDETTFAAPGMWEDADKVRAWRDRMEVLGGWTKNIASAVTGTCRNAYLWADGDLVENIALGTASALYVAKSGTLCDITPSAVLPGNEDYNANAGKFGYGYFGFGPFGGGALKESFPRTWSLANWDAYLIANPRGHGIYIWQNDTTALATAISNAPTACDTMMVTDTKQVAAFGCTSLAGVYSPMKIRFSDIEDYTSWTPTSSNSSDEVTLQEGTRIRRAFALGSYLAVWTDTALYLGTFQDVSEQPWKFDLIATECGLAAVNGVTVTNGTAYWHSPAGRFFMFRPDIGIQPIPCPISREFRDNLDTTEIDKLITFPVPKYEEVWWSYPDTRDGNECSRILIYSTTANVWSKATLDRTASVENAGEVPILVSASGYVYDHETGTTADGSSLTWSLQSTGTYYDEGTSRVHVLGVWPDFEAQSASVSMTLTTQDYPQASVTDKGPYTLAVGREKKDIRVEGRIIGTKWSGTGFCRFGKPVFEVVQGGRR